MPTSVRLNSARDFRHIQTVIIGTSVLDAVRPTQHVDAGRISTSSGTIHLERLTIFIDDEVDTEEDGPFLEIFPSSCVEFLGTLNPTKLAISIDPDEVDADSETTYVVSLAAAAAMSSWTRLRAVEIQDANLLTPSNEDEIIFDEFIGVFFLSQRGEHLTDPGEVEIVWELTDLIELSPMFAYDDLLDLLLHRDDMLHQSWVKSFTVTLSKQTLVDDFQRLVAASKEEIPSCLRWELTKLRISGESDDETDDDSDGKESTD